MSTSETSQSKDVGGRPRKEIDLQLLGLLAEAGSSIDEVAAMLTRSGADVDARTIKRRLKEPEYRDAWENGANVGKAKLRLQMVKQSKLMNSAGVSMAIHLSKHWLGMTDKSALQLNVDATVEVSSARERVNRKLDTIGERIASRVAGIAAAAGATRAPATAE